MVKFKSQKFKPKKFRLQHPGYQGIACLRPDLSPQTPGCDCMTYLHVCVYETLQSLNETGYGTILVYLKLSFFVSLLTTSGEVVKTATLQVML